MAGKVAARLPRSVGIDSQPPAKDFDPEEDAPSSGDDSGVDSEEERAGTEHYINVGKSKLRGKEPLALGPQYKGARVSREALEASDDDDDDEDDDEGSDESDSGDMFADPETADLEADTAAYDDDSEIDSDEAFAEGDEEVFKGYTFRGGSKGVTNEEKKKKRPIAADFMSDSDEEKSEEKSEDEDEEEDEEEEDSDEDGDGVDIGSDSSGDVDMNGLGDDADSGSSDDSDGGAPIGSDDDEEAADSDGSEADQQPVKKADANGKKAVFAAISDSARQDIEKGQAVRQQRKVFDGLLNLRVRLQKALVAVNTLGQIESDDSTGGEAYEAAEEAALKLWNTIDDLRSGIGGSSSKAGEKRKREVVLSTPTETIWEYTNANEQVARKQRRKTLDKWSNKIGATTIPMGNKLNLKTTRTTISTVLEEQLLEPERLVKRSRVPRSCAPLQASKGVKEDAGIYDDADFYQILLKELVDQRTADSEAAQSAGVATVQWAAMKEAKTSKVVDRRASRGRKMRFTVHEKLAGFMAVEDRRSWEREAIDRFFGTMFGRKMELNEDESDEEEEINAEEAGLRLFRS
ncbi:related to Che-1 protein [Cephalotrichum gorgonifer]|uniref:Protein BFR2 n=1 Tax=Cephalotrichum gorgonifer TaxID=2041049 RepID=A0AAE8MSZ4_9PEZI|nr:related to Che-1 protein [Cephalotrichum gorgonifer]